MESFNMWSLVIDSFHLLGNLEMQLNGRVLASNAWRPGLMPSANKRENENQSGSMACISTLFLFRGERHSIAWTHGITSCVSTHPHMDFRAVAIFWPLWTVLPLGHTWTCRVIWQLLVLECEELPACFPSNRTILHGCQPLWGLGSSHTLASTGFLFYYC